MTQPPKAPPASGKPLIQESEVPPTPSPAIPNDQAPDKAIAPLDTADWPREIGGKPGLEPTRYGDWEVNGRCTDF
jgi:hypothetical protein